jgi:hypothetical protein
MDNFLADNDTYAVMAKNVISVTPLLTPDVQQKYGLTRTNRPETLGDVLDGKFNTDFKNYVKQQIGLAVTLSSRDSVAIHTETLNDILTETPDVAFVQSNPDRGRTYMPSVNDWGAFFYGLTGRHNGSVSLVGTNDDAGRASVIEIGTIKPINANSTRNDVFVLRPSAPIHVFQSLLQAGQTMLNRLFDVNDGIKDPGQLAVARAALDAAYEIHSRGLSPDQLKAVWSVVGEYTTVKMDADLNNISRGTLFEGMGVDQLVSELIGQMRELSGRNPSLQMINRQNALPLLGVQVGRHFDDVAAMPKASVLPWLAQKFLTDINSMALVNAVEAKKRLEAIGAVDEDQVARSLYAFAQVGANDSDRQLMPAVEALIRGENTETALQENVLRMIARGVDTETGVRVYIQDAATYDKRFNGGKAFISGNDIYLRHEANTTFVDMALALMHEMGHPVVERALATYPGGEAGVPTTIVEALTQGIVSQRLRNSRHIALADALDKIIYQKIIEQEQDGRVIYVPLSGIANRDIADIEAIRQRSGGMRRVVGVVAAKNLAAAQRIHGQRLDLVTEEYLTSVPALPNETILEAHGRLFYGTQNVSLMTTENSLKGLEGLVSVNGKVVDEIIRIVNAITVDALYKRFDEQKARLIARQA